MFLLFLLFSLEFQRSEGNRHCFLLLPALPFLPDKSFDHAREVPEGVPFRLQCRSHSKQHLLHVGWPVWDYRAVVNEHVYLLSVTTRTGE